MHRVNFITQNPDESRNASEMNDGECSPWSSSHIFEKAWENAQ